LKTTNLADKLLFFMVKEHKQNPEKEIFDLDYFETHFPNSKKDQLIDAIHLLESDGYVSVFYADDIPYTITLLTSAIRQVEENTLLKKGYSLAKMIKDLIP